MTKRQIFVTKFGNEPNIFGNDLRYGMIGEWEITKLLKVLSDDPDNEVFYFGKAIWDKDKANKYFTNIVHYIDATSMGKLELALYDEESPIDEFHILLGPHAYYNGGKVIPAWESIKESMVPKRLLERVAPQIRLMNFHKDAKLFFYMTDRRFLLKAADLDNLPNYIYAQNVKDVIYDAQTIVGDDYSNVKTKHITAKAFRFDTIWLYDKSYEEYEVNRDKVLDDKHISLVIPANQVTSDDEIKHSRMQKILDYTDYIKDYVVVGKWTSDYAKEEFSKNSNCTQLLEGLALEDYNKTLKASEYALVTFNTDDSPSMFDNNYLTPKYWECVFNGCLTFVEGDNMPFIPAELQVKDGKELRSKLNKCKKNPRGVFFSPKKSYRGSTKLLPKNPIGGSGVYQLF